MAKKVHGYQLKGVYYHETGVIAEYDKKTEQTNYYRISDILSGLDQKEISFAVKEEEGVPSVTDPYGDGE